MGEESKIERRVSRDALTKLGIPSVKWGDDGWPDRLFLTPGRPFIIEFKAPGEDLMPRQAHRIKCLLKWGYDVEVHDDYGRAFSAIRDRLESARLHEERNEISPKS